MELKSGIADIERLLERCAPREELVRRLALITTFDWLHDDAGFSARTDALLLVLHPSASELTKLRRDVAAASRIIQTKLPLRH